MFTCSPHTARPIFKFVPMHLNRLRFSTHEIWSRWSTAILRSYLKFVPRSRYQKSLHARVTNRPDLLMYSNSHCLSGLFCVLGLKSASVHFVTVVQFVRAILRFNFIYMCFACRDCRTGLLKAGFL